MVQVSADPAAGPSSALCFNAAVSAPIVADGPRGRRRPLILLGALGLLVLAVVVAAVALGAVRSGNRTRPRPRRRHRDSWRKPRPPASTTSTTASTILRRRRRGGVRLRRRRQARRSTSPAAAGPRPCSRTRVRSAARSVSSGCPTRDRPHAVTGAYPLDIDGDGITDLAVLRRGENVLLRGLGDCRFERANEAWTFDGGNYWTTAFSASWEEGATWPTVAFGNYHDETYRPSEPVSPTAVRPAPGGGAFARPTTLTRPGARSRCSSATGTGRAAGPAGENDPTTTAT